MIFLVDQLLYLSINRCVQKNREGCAATDYSLHTWKDREVFKR